MSRFIRNTAILAKIESSYGVDASPTGAANALLVSNVTVTPMQAQNVDRDIIRPHFGASEQLVGDRYVEAAFDIEIAGSGTAGDAPACAPLLRACAMAEDDQAGHVAYTPVTNSQASITIHIYDSGILHVLTGARGTVELNLQQGERPTMRFTFRGLYTTPSASAVPATTLTAWQRPLVVTNANSGDITFGASYSAGGVTGGTTYASRGLTLDLGNEVVHTPLLGGEEIDITARAVTATMQLDLSASQEATFMATVEANTTQSLAFQHGATAGNIFLLHAPAVQLVNPSKQDFNGRRLIGFDARFVPVSGNDELVLVFK